MIECFDCDKEIGACTCALGPRTMSDIDSIPCPWCGALIRDLYEFGDSQIVECDHCNRDIDLEIDRAVTYVARRVLPAEMAVRAVEAEGGTNG